MLLWFYLALPWFILWKVTRMLFVIPVMSWPRSQRPHRMERKPRANITKVDRVSLIFLGPLIWFSLKFNQSSCYFSSMKRKQFRQANDGVSLVWVLVGGCCVAWLFQQIPTNGPYSRMKKPGRHWGGMSWTSVTDLLVVRTHAPGEFTSHVLSFLTS